MLPTVLFELSLFGPGDDRGEAETDLGWLLEALTQRNQAYLKDHPDTPHLYRSGVKYIRPAQMLGECDEVRTLRNALGRGANKPEVAEVLRFMQQILGGERFRDIGRIIANGGGDCFPMAQKIIVRSKSTGHYELVAIGDLRFVYPSYEALSYNFRTCQYEFKSIIGFVDKGMKAVSKARLSNGADLVATDDHKFWSVDGSGSNGRRIGTRTMGEYVEASVAFRKGRMTKGCRTARSRIIQAARIPALGAVKTTPATAYLAGMYAAEGEFSDGKHTRIGQHKSAVRQKIELALSDAATTFHYAPGRGRTVGSGAQYSLHGGAANPIVAMMRAQGVDSFSKRLPQELLSADAETVATLLAGHGDGDAWRPANGAFKRPGVEAIYATSSDFLMEQLRLGTLILGRPAYAYRYEDHGGSGTKPIWRLHEYNTSASRLATRAELVDRDLGLPGLRYGTVRHAMPFGTAHVGCVEVEDNHNFVLADGTLASNCDNMAAWRAAELRQAGVQARPMMTSRPNGKGGTVYHAIVRWPPIVGVPYETDEDPSLLTGMGGDARAFERQIEVNKNRERAEHLRDAQSGSPMDQALAQITAASSARSAGNGPSRIRVVSSSSDPTTQAAISDLDELLGGRHRAA